MEVRGKEKIYRQREEKISLVPLRDLVRVTLEG